MPWVMGKIGDWTLPFGPYTPAQIAVAFIGAFVLIKTFTWWRVLGPVPVVALGVAVWAVRRARIGGRTPFNFALGMAAYLAQPRGGRINGRGVRPQRVVFVHGGCVIEDVPHVEVGAGPEAASEVCAQRSVTLHKAGTRLHARAAHRTGAGRGVVPVEARPLPAPTAMQQMLRGRDGADRMQSVGGGRS